MKVPDISIIIPARNEDSIIGTCIESILNQTLSSFELIVVNDGSTDRTKDIVSQYKKKDKRIILVNFKEGHSAAFARNRGAKKARGKILFFLDADTGLNKNFLKEIVSNSEGADGFQYSSSPKATTFLSKIIEGMVKYKKSTDCGLVFCLTKKAYKEIGGYNEDIFYFEDAEFAKSFHKLGFKSKKIDSAIQWYELPATFSEFKRQCKWIGKGINTIPSKRKRVGMKKYWSLKLLFLVLPLFSIFNFQLLIFLVSLELLIIYLNLISRNKKIILSFFVVPFVYIKTIIVNYYLIKFWKK